MIPKFRFYNKKDGMIEVISIDFKHNEITGFANNRYGFFSTEKIKLMQSTGLKDKNGVEIYEGDKNGCLYCNNRTT